jgi:hypothetical protein
MHNCHQIINNQGLSGSDYIAIIAIIVSLTSLFFSIYLIWLTKKMEILYQEYESLCIKNVESILSGLDNLFKEKELENVVAYRNQITNSMLELQGFLVILRNSIYNKIDVQHFVEIIEDFTNKVYGTNDASLLEFKGDYYSTKLKIYNDLYNYALEQELHFMKFLKKKKRP